MQRHQSARGEASLPSCPPAASRALCFSGGGSMAPARVHCPEAWCPHTFGQSVALLPPLLSGRGDGVWLALLLLPSPAAALRGAGTATDCPMAPWGGIFPLRGWEWSPNCSPWGKSPSPPCNKVAVGHPGFSCVLCSPGSMPEKPGLCGGSWLVLWLLVAHHGTARLRVAKAGWWPWVPGEMTRDRGQSRCKELVGNAVGGLHHRCLPPTRWLCWALGAATMGKGQLCSPGSRRAPPKLLLLGTGQAAAGAQHRPPQGDVYGPRTSTEQEQGAAW